MRHRLQPRSTMLVVLVALLVAGHLGVVGLLVRLLLAWFRAR
jgi:hypothetical protein